MKIKKIISISIALGMLFDYSLSTFASTLSEDTRYETFEGSNIIINDILEPDKADVEVEGNTLINLMDSNWKGQPKEIYQGESCFKITEDEWIQQKISNIKKGGTYTLIYKYISTELIKGTTNPFGRVHLTLYNSDTWVYDIPVKNFESNKSEFTTSVSVFTLPSNMDYTKMHITGMLRDIEGTVWLCDEIFLLEGDWSNKDIPSYFEGIKSVGQDNENGHRIEIISNSSDGTQSSKIEISLSEPLRSLLNGVNDRIVKINGQWMVERNCAEIVLDGSEKWALNSSWTNENFLCAYISNSKRLDSSYMLSDKFISLKYSETLKDGLVDKECLRYDASSNGTMYIFISKAKLESYDIDGLKKWLSENPVKVIYQLATPVYEPLNIYSNINLYEYTTHISTNSNIPANLKVIVDRVVNRAKEYSDIAKENPTIENISKARMWVNLMKESILKDEFQENIDSITEITDMTLERKSITSNIDVYVKSDNALSMTLSTNSIVFDDFSGVEDLEHLNAINITVNSSLSYQLNSYLESDIKNTDGSEIISKELLNIRLNGENEYKAFTNINEKLVLKDNCIEGNYNQFSIDLILKGSLAHKSDIYKTVIKFEAEQK